MAVSNNHSTSKLEEFSSSVKSVIKLSFIDFLEMLEKPYTGLRYELTGGYLIIRSTPNTEHQSLATYLKHVLTSYTIPRDLGKVIGELTIKYSEEDTQLPDVLYLANDELQFQTRQYIDGNPSLVIEIASPQAKSRRKDYVENLEKAKRNKVKEYWVVNPWEQLIDQWILQNDEYKNFTFRATTTDMLTSHLPQFEDFQLSVKALFDYAKK